MALRRKTESALDRVEELRHAAAAERRRERELDGEREAANAAREEARERLVAALAAGGDGEDERRVLEEAEQRAGVRWAEVKEAARRRVVAADRAVVRHIAENFEAIKPRRSPATERPTIGSSPRPRSYRTRSAPPMSRRGPGHHS